MKLSASSSQSELRALYVRVTRDEFLRDTPLNLRMFLRYALLFVLFPSMVFGFRIGLTVMAGFCGGMIVCMLAGKYDLAHAAVVCWLLFGAVALLVVAGSTLITARKRLRKRRTPRPADAPLPSRGAEPIFPGDTRELLWTPGDAPHVFTSSLELHVTHPGIWAVTVEIRDCGHSKLMLPDSCGLCPLHSGNQGQELRSVVLCRLESGVQHIPWILVSDLPHPPASHRRHSLHAPRGMTPSARSVACQAPTKTRLSPAGRPKLNSESGNPRVLLEPPVRDRREAACC